MVDGQAIEQDWSAYQTMERHLQPANELLLDAVAESHVPGSLLVDLGAGRGGGVEAARQRGWGAVGVEIDGDQLAQADQRTPMICGDVTATSLRTGCADALISNFGVIFALQPGAAIAEAARVVRPRGRFALSLWRPDGWPDRCRRALSGVIGDVAPSFPSRWGTDAGVAELCAGTPFVVDEVVERRLEWRFVDHAQAATTLMASGRGLQAMSRRARALGRLDDAAEATMLALDPLIEPDGGHVVVPEPYIELVLSRS